MPTRRIVCAYCGREGEIAVWGSPKSEGAGPGRERGLGEVLVELKNEKEVLRDFTDGAGRFSFRGIRPGKWVVKFHAGNLPKGHFFEKEEFTIELKPGERREINGKVSPRPKAIKIIDAGEIKQERKETRHNAKAPELSARKNDPSPRESFQPLASEENIR